MKSEPDRLYIWVQWQNTAKRQQWSYGASWPHLRRNLTPCDVDFRRLLGYFSRREHRMSIRNIHKLPQIVRATCANSSPCTVHRVECVTVRIVTRLRKADPMRTQPALNGTSTLWYCLVPMQCLRYSFIDTLLILNWWNSLMNSYFTCCLFQSPSIPILSSKCPCDQGRVKHLVGPTHFTMPGPQRLCWLMDS